MAQISRQAISFPEEELGTKPLKMVSAKLVRYCRIGEPALKHRTTGNGRTYTALPFKAVVKLQCLYCRIEQTLTAKPSKMRILYIQLVRMFSWTRFVGSLSKE